MTYWIIVVMMLVAIVAVVLALSSERSSPLNSSTLTAEKEQPLDDDE